MDTLTKILGTSAELFRQYGFRAITMDDIARRAGISKKTLYQHFANKSEIVCEALTAYMNRVASSCREVAGKSENAVAAMVQFISLFEESHRQTHPATLLELQRYHPDGYVLFREHLLKHDVELIHENIMQGIGDGLYRPEINADLLSRYFVESSLMVFQPHLLLRDQYDLRQLQRELTEHFLYGIMTPKGEKLYRKYKEKFLKK